MEHLETQTRDVMHDLMKVPTPGGVYLGDYTPLSCGCFGRAPTTCSPPPGRPSSRAAFHHALPESREL